MDPRPWIVAPTASTVNSTPSPTDASPNETTCPATSGWIELGGRPVLLRSPAAPARLPTLVVLHGFTSTPELLEQTSGLTEAAASAGALIAFPRGNPIPGEAGFGWTSGAGKFATRRYDDVASLRTIITELIASHCADPTRIAMGGESNGAGMVVRSICSPLVNSLVTLAITANSAVDAPVIAHCSDDGLGPVPLLAVAGLADTVVRYSGRPPLLAQQDWFGQVAFALNGCVAAFDHRARSTLSSNSSSLVGAGPRPRWTSYGTEPTRGLEDRSEVAASIPGPST